MRHANPAQASKEWRGAVFDTGMRPSDEALERHAGLPSSEQDGVCRAQIVQAAGILIGKEVRVKIARADEPKGRNFPINATIVLISMLINAF